MRTSTRIAAALLALTTGLLAGCGTDTDQAANDTGGDRSETSSPSSPPTESSTESSTEPTKAPPSSNQASDTTAVPLYFVGNTPLGPRLFREFQAVDPEDPGVEAAALLVQGEPLDSDYRSLLPALDVFSVVVDQDAGFIDVKVGEDSPTSDKSISRRDGRLAMQQLVYTLQGVSQTELPVRIVAGDDDTPLSLFGINTAQGVKAAPELNVLGVVNVTTPAEGDTVSGSLNAEGRSSSFEGTTAWSILDADGKLVLKGSAQSDETYLKKLAEWKTQIDVSSLEPGSYTFVAFSDNAAGDEGPPPTRDTKNFTIQ